MIRVLFVCLGNICRSPMAEAVFRDLVRKRGLTRQFHIDSAGTGDWHIGHPPHQGTKEILMKKEITCDGLKGRLITDKDIHDFDYIIAMDQSNVDNIKALDKNSQTGNKVYRLLDFLPERGERDIPDPYYTGRFKEVYELVFEGAKALLEHICSEKNIKEDILLGGEL